MAVWRVKQQRLVLFGRRYALKGLAGRRRNVGHIRKGVADCVARGRVQIRSLEDSARPFEKCSALRYDARIGYVIRRLDVAEQSLLQGLDRLLDGIDHAGVSSCTVLIHRLFLSEASSWASAFAG